MWSRINGYCLICLLGCASHLNAQQQHAVIDLFNTDNVYLTDSIHSAPDSLTRKDLTPEIIKANKLFRDTLEGQPVIRFEGDVKLQIASVTITTEQAYLNTANNNVYIRDKDLRADFKDALIYGHGMVYKAETAEIIIDEKRLGK